MRRRLRLAGCLFGLLVVLFWPYWLEHHIPLNGDWLDARFLPWSAVTTETSTNPELDDPILFLYPLRFEGTQALRHGELPLWNPAIMCGTPLFEDQCSMPLCPWNLWMDVLPPLDGWTWLLWSELLVAGVGMALLLDDMGLPSAACLLGAVSFMLSSSFAQSLEWPSFLGTYGWLPWMALGVERLRRGQSGVWLLALAIGLQFWCGMIQLCLYFLGATAMLLGLRLLQSKTRGALVGRAFVALVLGLGLGVVVLIPTAHLLALSARATVKYLDWVRPAALLTYVWPDIFGHPARGDYVPVTGLYLLAFSGYIGFWSGCLALVAVRREPERLPYLVLAAVLPLYLMTTASSLFLGGMEWFFPAFFMVDHPRAVGVFTFAASVLAGCGLADLWKDPDRRQPALRRLVVVGTALCALALVLENLPVGPDSTPLLRFFVMLRMRYGTALLSPNLLCPIGLWLAMLGWTALCLRRSRRLWAAGVVSVVALDLLRGVWAWNAFVPTSAIYPSTPALSWLQAHAADGRVLALDPPGSIRGRTGLLPPNSELPYGLQDVRGYLSLLIGSYAALSSSRPDNYFHAIPDPDWPLVSLLGVRYVVTRDALDSRYWKLVFNAEVRIYENQRPSPRAFVVSGLEVVDEAAVGPRLRDASAPRPDRLWVSAAAAQQLPRPVPGRPQWVPARVLEALNNHVTVASDTTFAGYLVLADAMYDGWTATVDGRPTPVVTAFGALRAVAVPAGSHTVRFDYRPLRIYLSAAVSGLALLGVVAATWWEKRSCPAA